MLTSRLGIQSWCFRSYKETGKIIEALKLCGVDRIELCGIHVDLNHPQETLKQFSDNGIRISSFGVNGFTTDEAAARKVFEFAVMADFPVDIMLHPSEVRGENGLRAMRALLMTYVNHFGHAIHFNVMDADQLRQAQREPEKFRDLQVRICGWNVLWNSLSRKEQDAYIQQAER